MDAQFNINVKKCGLNDVKNLFNHDDCEVIKFNRFSPRLAGKDFSAETIQNQIIGLNNIINDTYEVMENHEEDIKGENDNVIAANFSKKEENIEDYVRMYEVKNVERKNYDSNTDVKYIKSLSGKKKIMDAHNYYVEEEDTSFYDDIIAEDEMETKSPIKYFFSKILSSLLGKA